MKIKVDGVYLDFNDVVEVERQFTLFEEISTTAGDFSYSFNLAWTRQNRDVLEVYSVNQANKRIYKLIPAVIETDGGVALYNGYLRVERTIVGNESSIPCSFFSGNYNWLNRITGNLTEVDFSDLGDIQISKSYIESTFTNTSGIIFPVINFGSLTTRAIPVLVTDDFHPFVYVHDIVKHVFAGAGLKITGELLNDIRYKRMITSRSKASINAQFQKERTVYVGTEISQGFNDSALTELNFELITEPYSVGDKNNFINNSQYQADTHMIVDFTWILNFDISSVASGDTAFYLARFYVNGSFDMAEDASAAITSSANTITYTKEINAGDVVEMLLSVIVFGPSGPTGQTINVTSATWSAVPKVIFKRAIYEIVPDMPAADFIAQLFSMFNTIVDYDPYTKTVKVDLLKNVRYNSSILDVSGMVNSSEDIETDYTDFVSSYGRFAVIGYGESSVTDIDQYNINNRIPYSSIEIDSENEFETESTDILDLDFVAVYEDVNNTFKSFLPKLDWKSLTTSNEQDVTTVNDVGSVAEFAANGFNVGDIVRISESTIKAYNGDWRVYSATATSFQAFGLLYSGNATLKAAKVTIEPQDDNDPVFLISVPDVAVSYFTPLGGFFYNLDPTLNAATAYFVKPIQGLPIDEQKHTLAFGLPNLPNMFQVTMYEDYWKDFAGVLKDPVKKFLPVFMPETDFINLKPSTQVRLTIHNETALYFINRFTGYKGSKEIGIMELVKIP